MEGGKTRHTANRAAALRISATAHKLARIIYSLLTQGTTYEDPGKNAYEEKYQQRIRQNLKQKSRKLDCILVSIETGEEITI